MNSAIFNKNGHLRCDIIQALKASCCYHFLSPDSLLASDFIIHVLSNAMVEVKYNALFYRTLNHIFMGNNYKNIFLIRFMRSTKIF